MNISLIQKLLASAEISDRSFWVLNEIFVNGKSIDDLAKEKDVTKPRIRSVMMKALRDFFNTVGNKNVKLEEL